MNIRRLFITYLIEREALENYKTAFYNDFKNIALAKNIGFVPECLMPEEWITKAFLWPFTKEGAEYWGDICGGWFIRLKEANR